MKKLVSIILSVIMVFSVCAVSAIPASAKVVSPGSETIVIEVGTTVNSKVSVEIEYSKNPENPYEITFTYTGDGVLLGWTFIPDNVKVIAEKGKSITILVDASVNKVVANAIVKDATPQPEVPQGDSTSPSTGAMTLSGLAITGAGIAVLSALKKKNDEQ